jgi:DNA-binding FrmR family transcriptional regulator
LSRSLRKAPAAVAAEGAADGQVADGPGGAVAACGCGAAAEPDGDAGGRLAVAVDPDVKARNLARLRRIEGQVRGLQRMVEGDRYCADVLTQIASVHEALRGVGRELMRNHLRHCATTAIREGGERAEQTYDELLDLMYRSAR